MYERAAAILVWTIYLYFAGGVVVALMIVFFGLGRIDAATRGSGIGFRLIVFPGLIALWPLMLSRFIWGTGSPPLQEDPHR